MGNFKMVSWRLHLSTFSVNITDSPTVSNTTSISKPNPRELRRVSLTFGYNLTHDSIQVAMDQWE